MTVARTPKTTTRSIADRVNGLDWQTTTDGLDEIGMSPIGSVLSVAECQAFVDMYDDVSRFRSTIDMAPRRYGSGQYRYFDHPLPPAITQLRSALWPHLLAIGREWAARRDQPAPWPDDFEDWLALCHAAGQRRPTPLMLSYGPGDWNALHRDLYGDLVFPLQVVIGLDRPDHDYTGGEFVMVEQRPRAQSRATVAAIGQGHGIVFTTRDRPVRTKHGWAKAPMRHGVSSVRTGRRRTVGLIFHDAE